MPTESIRLASTAAPIRRRLILAGGAAAVLARAGRAHAQAQRLVLRLGRLPFDTLPSLMPLVMRDQRLLERIGATLGYEIVPEWSDFPTGAPIAQGLVGDRLDIAPIGMTPLLNLYNNRQQVVPFAVGGGRLKFHIVVRRGSPIRNMEDVRGKTLALVVGTDYQFALNNILAASFDSADVRSLGINLVNVSTPAQLALVPQGSDVAITHAHPFLKAEAEVGTLAIANSHGYTDGHYRGPLGEGAGHLLPRARNASSWPEGVFGHRVFWVVRERVLQEHPRVVTTFMLAMDAALRHLRGLGPEGAAALGQRDWGVEPPRGKVLIEDDLVWRRGWSFLTQGDARTMWNQTQTVIENRVITPREPFTWAGIKGLFDRAAGPARAAWEALNGTPNDATFNDGANDHRGLPNWQSSQWGG